MQSEKVIDVYKEDLQEFTNSLASDTKEALNKSGKFVQKIATETENFQDVDEENVEEPLTDSAAKTDESIRQMTSKITTDIKNTISSFFGEYEAKEDISTSETAKEIRVYIQDPENIDKYKEWSSSFCLEDNTSDISQRLSSDSFLRQVHSQLVPEKVTSKDFWQRFYFAQQETEETEKKRATILARWSFIHLSTFEWVNYKIYLRTFLVHIC